MKILALHPEDHYETGPWSGQKWTQIIDLGLGGEETYDRWRRFFRCEASSLRSYRSGFADVMRVGELLGAGKGRLLDREGLDWWELTAILVHQKLEALLLLRKFAETLRPNDELYITRPGFEADVFQRLLGGRLHTFARKDLRLRRPIRYLGLGIKFPIWQLIQIFWDKYDPAHEVRGRFARKPTPSRLPVVLLPTAYVNVTHSALAYAKSAPDLRFHLVATRKSGWPSSLPNNVTASWLAGYSSLAETSSVDDTGEILAAWEHVRRELEMAPEIGLAGKLGVLDAFPAWIRQGIKQRATWKAVLQHQPVQAVLCADDSNPSTHIPVMLARKFRLPTVVCHHGALDGRYMIKQNHADIILVKGKMEKDYLVRVCRVPGNEVEIGAPAPSAKVAYAGELEASAIILFSELYEAFTGRSEEFYRDLLPPLAQLAVRWSKKLVVKLHPAESRGERQRMVHRILPPEQRSAVTVVAGATTPELLRKAWFGVTVLSTVATECARLRIPCFLCRWLEFSPYGYIDQFVRFGVGYALESPSEIAKIPQILRTYKVRADVTGNLSQSIEPHRLEQLLTAGVSLAAGPQNATEQAI